MPIYHFRSEPIDRTFLFIHIPKTGGTAIERYFKAVGLASFYDPDSYRQIRSSLKIPLTHMDYGLCDRLFRLEIIYSFTIVRHPVHRMVSEYKWVVQKSALPERVKKYSFSEFLEFAFEMYRQDEDFLSGHLKPQRLFVGEKLSRIFKYETGLNAIVAEVFKEAGLMLDGKIDVPMINSSARLEVKITDADIDAIQKMYADDFALFGYSPEHKGLAARE